MHESLIYDQENEKNLEIRLTKVIPEKGICVHGKENWENLTIREAIQSRHVGPIEPAAVVDLEVLLKKRKMQLFSSYRVSLG